MIVEKDKSGDQGQRYHVKATRDGAAIDVCWTDNFEPARQMARHYLQSSDDVTATFVIDRKKPKHHAIVRRYGQTNTKGELH